jgi:hypothetical protein
MAGSDDSDVGDSEGVRSDSSTSSIVFFAVALEIEAAKSGIKRARSISIAVKRGSSLLTPYFFLESLTELSDFPEFALRSC